MCTEVYKHQHIETGGNLFGLWTTSGSAVIHVALGPGQGCRRTNTSFHQDLEYMARVGRFVNKEYMLCHIGEWHSHHNLSLSKPSAGDESTIRRNFPQGMSKFLVIIANIRNGDTIKLSPYFFTDGGEHYEIAEYVVLKSNGPFSNDDKIVAEINLGAEGKECPQNETNHSRASLTVTQTPRNTRSNSPWTDNTCPTYSQAVSRNSHENPRNTDSSTQRDNNTNSTTQSQATSTNSFTENGAEPTPMDTDDSPGDRPTPPADRTSSQASNNPPEGNTPQNQTSSGSPDEATTKEIVLKKIKDGLEKYFGSEGKVDIGRTSHGDVQMIFKHDTKYWMLRFPETFPNQPARLSSAHSPERLSKMSPCSDYFPVKPLTNHVNVLLFIKKNCYDSCRICKNITKENLAKPTAAVPPDNSKVTDVLNELTKDIKMTLSIPLTFVSQAQNDGSNRIEFQHYHATWSIEIPAEFPDKPAEVYKQESSHRDPEKKTINDSSKSKHEQKSLPLISSDFIMLAIRSNCHCSKCYRI
jgi:integrative and conjugative element protein (TIGR02256 family)